MRIRAFGLLFIFLSMVFFVGSLCAQSDPSVYISAPGDFAGAITAAFIKKNVPATIVEDKKHAQYILQSTSVDSRDETGAGKIARCMFMSCAGMNGFSSVSVELINTTNSAVVWAYQVRKGNSGPVALQSLSEAIAKHLKNDYFKKSNKW